MIDRYELDIYELREKKKETDDGLLVIVNESKEKQERTTLLDGLEE